MIVDYLFMFILYIYGFIIVNKYLSLFWLLFNQIIQKILTH